MRDRPSEAASRPAASGARSRPRGVGAAHDRGKAQQRLGRQPEFLDHRRRTCKARRDGSRTRPPRRTASRRSARRPPPTSDGVTNRNTARGSTKRRMSQGQAMRSIFGRARVTQTVRPCRVARRQLGGRDERQAGFAPASMPPSSAIGGDARMAEPGRDALAELQALLADDDGGAAGEVLPPSADGSAWERRHEPGMQPRIGGEILVGADIDEGGASGRADQASELVSGDGIDRRHGLRPWHEKRDAMLRHVASWGDRIPHPAPLDDRPPLCQCRPRPRPHHLEPVTPLSAVEERRADARTGRCHGSGMWETSVPNRSCNIRVRPSAVGANHRKQFFRESSRRGSQETGNPTTAFSVRAPKGDKRRGVTCRGEGILDLKRPEDCLSQEIDGFCELVRVGGEVTSAGLQKRVQRAAILAFLHEDGRLIGISALKRPDAGHRAGIFKKGIIPLTHV